MRLSKNSTLGRRKLNLSTASSSKLRSNSKKQKPTSKAPVPVHHQSCTADDGGSRWQFVRRDGEELTARKAHEDFGPPNFLVHVMYGGSFVEGDVEGFHNMKYEGGVCATLYNFNLQLHYLSDLEGFGAALLKSKEFNTFYVGYHRAYQCDSWKLLKNNDRLQELFNRVDGISNCVWVYLATYEFESWVDSEELLLGMEDEERDSYDVPYLLDGFTDEGGDGVKPVDGVELYLEVGVGVNLGDGVDEGNREDGADEGNKEDGVVEGNKEDGIVEGNKEDGVVEGNKEDGAVEGNKEDGANGNNEDGADSEDEDYQVDDYENDADTDTSLDSGVDSEYDNEETNADEGFTLSSGVLWSYQSASKVPIHNENEDVDIGDSDCELSNSDSENEHYPKYEVLNPKTDMKNPQFKEQLVFNNVGEFRAAVREYGIIHGRDLKFTINEGHKVQIKCKKGCEWYLYASLMQRERGFQIRRHVPTHAPHCVREWENKHVTYKWLALKYLETIAINPGWPTEAFRADLSKAWNVGASDTKLYRAKRAAIHIIEGTIREQYSKLWCYMKEIKRSDPDGTIEVDLWPLDEEDPESKPKFHRMYVCLGACKKGFKAGCRQVVGLDGTHLKGVTKGQLLTAVGIDANNQMFVIAYAAVDAEIYDNWIWFLELLKKDLEINNSHGWCFMTDKQKGLLDAVGELFPNAEHKNCMKHLASNFRKSNPGIEGRGLLWAASKSNHVPLYDWVMEKFKKEDNEGYKWLHDKPPQ